MCNKRCDIAFTLAFNKERSQLFQIDIGNADATRLKYWPSAEGAKHFEFLDNLTLLTRFPGANLNS